MSEPRDDYVGDYAFNFNAPTRARTILDAFPVDVEVISVDTATGYDPIVATSWHRDRPDELRVEVWSSDEVDGEAFPD